MMKVYRIHLPQTHFAMAGICYEGTPQRHNSGTPTRERNNYGDCGIEQQVKIISQQNVIYTTTGI